MQAGDQAWIELVADGAHGTHAPDDEVPDRDAIERALADEFPEVRIAGAGRRSRPHGVLAVSAAVWSALAFDPQSFDRALAEAIPRGALRLVVLLDRADAATAVVQMLTRAQPYLDRRNGHSRGPRFDQVLAAHHALHDLEKPLVRADYAHALDVWQWTLRLSPDASLALQLAALFHDVERLASEADARIEQHAGDYVAFKRAHARAGASIARGALADVGLEGATLDRALELVATHETPSPDDERGILNDADALSFFSLNSAGFLDYYGVDHTQRKVAYTLSRLSAEARERLARIRLRADVAALVADELAHHARDPGSRRGAGEGVGV